MTRRKRLQRPERHSLSWALQCKRFHQDPLTSTLLRMSSMWFGNVLQRKLDGIMSLIKHRMSLKTQSNTIFGPCPKTLLIRQALACAKGDCRSLKPREDGQSTVNFNLYPLSYTDLQKLIWVRQCPLDQSLTNFLWRFLSVIKATDVYCKHKPTAPTLTFALIIILILIITIIQEKR